MPIDIFRHAQSTANAGLPSDQPDTIPLTALGHAQALALSLTFNASAPPELIVTSPYIRTSQTAAPTRARFPDTPHEVWPIHEFTHLDITRYRGSTQIDRSEDSERYWQRNDPDYNDGTGAESFNQLVGRIDDFLNRIRNLKQQNVAVFSHGMFMRVLLLRLIQPDLKDTVLMQLAAEARELVKIPNTARMRLDYSHSGRLAAGFSPMAA